jgi:hypothetical protein
MPFDADSKSKSTELDNILEARYEYHADYWIDISDDG